MEQAKPALLEPVMRVEVEAPEEFAGALMADLNSRRGRVQGMETSGAGTLIRAEVPMAEMLSYGSSLTAMTQGRGTFRMDTDHYDLVPHQLAEKIVATVKRPITDSDD
jgi:elongation factor G